MLDNNKEQKSMIKRIYFLTSEIVPFAETYPLALFSKEVPLVFIERKYDFRVMMPKYNFISERRYILREVIRLREMEVLYKNQNVKASVKSAFIPNTKVQVYFLEHEKYFNLPSDNLYSDSPSDPEINNFNKMSYFALSALTTLNYLRWKPEVIICNDWQTSLIPLLIKSGAFKSEFVEGVKILQIVHSISDKSLVSKNEFNELGITELPLIINEEEKIDCLASSIALCDHTLFLNYPKTNLNDQYKKIEKVVKPAKGRISNYTLTGLEPEDWQKLADEIVHILEKV